MNVIIFSKNRACQLELLIRSMKKFFMEFSDVQIKILYKFTDDNFEKAYLRTKDIHNDINIIWTLETDFQKDLISLVDKSQKHTMFFVDDIIFKEPFSMKDDKFKFFDSHGDVLCLSLRLHPRLTYSYPPNQNMKSPIFDKNLVYKWIGEDACYGYSLSLDGNIYRTMDIFFYIQNLKYNAPNSLEAQMASNPSYVRPKIICYNKSIVFNNPCNKVQMENQNRHGDVSPEFINEQFLNDKIIDIEPFIGLENNACHMLLDIKFIDL